MKRPKRGDLVYDCANGKKGIVIMWQKYGGKEPALWSILYEDGKIDSALENEIEVISEVGS